MAVLIEKQIKDGFNCFYGNEVRPRAVVELSEYDGEDSLTINCTQLEEEYSAKEKKRIKLEWCDFFVNNPDISKLENLQALEYLSIGSGRGVLSIEPISKLENLVALSIENFQKIHDYSPLANLKSLKVFL
ncbi:MAG: hypothetical protein ACLUBD_05035 [Veillonella parvula]|jgi:hypothetical protein|uniref:hypothetical protein n=1 Tax=Veillonella parvula TaxID=29466 RepID=UPI003994401F